jgi:hypothetical protein
MKSGDDLGRIRGEEEFMAELKDEGGDVGEVGVGACGDWGWGGSEGDDLTRLNLADMLRG